VRLLRNLLSIAVVLVMVSVGVLFALQNRQQVPLDLLVYTLAPKSVALWVLSALALGGVLGVLVSSLIMMRMRIALGSTKRQLDKARAEVRGQATEGATAEAL